MTSDRPPASRPFAVVATFRPDTRLLGLIASLSADCDVIVVDDGSGRESADLYSRASALGAYVVSHGRNRGIAAALNTGVGHSFERGAEAVFTFDQDSQPPSGFVRDMQRGLVRARRTDGLRPGLLVPEYFARVRQAHGAERAPHLFDGRKVIQSGMLIPRDTWESLGAFREDYFIDLVDTEYEMRACVAGLDVLAVGGVRMPHALGRRVRLTLLPGVHATTSVSTPFRFYYRARNRVVFTRTYVASAPFRVVGEALIDVAFFGVAALGARPRGSLLRLLLKGVADGRRGRMGPIPGAVAAMADGISWDGVEIAE